MKMKNVLLLIVIVIVICLIISVYAEKSLAENSKLLVPIFVSNQQITENLGTPDDLFPVYRAVDRETPITGSIRLTISPELDLYERALGFESDWDSDHGVKVVGVNLQSGLLTIELSDPQQFTYGGSHRVRRLREKLVKTSLQFEKVKEVEFKGPEWLFEP